MMKLATGRLPFHSLPSLILCAALLGSGCAQTGQPTDSSPAPAETPEEPRETEEIKSPEPVETAPPLTPIPEWAKRPKAPALNLEPAATVRFVPTPSSSPEDWSMDVALQSGHPGDAYTVKFTPDGRCLATGGGEGSDAAVRLWDLSTRNELRYIPQPYAVERMAFSPDGSILDALGGLFETATGKRIHGSDSTEAYGDGRVPIWFPSADWKHIVSSEWNSEEKIGWLRVLDADTKKSILNFKNAGKRAWNVQFAANAPRFVAQIQDLEAGTRILRVHDWEAKKVLVGVPKQDADFYRLSPDGKHLLLAKKEVGLRVIDLAKPSENLWELTSIPAKSIQLPKGSGYMADGKHILIGHANGNCLLMLDAKTGEVKRKFVAPDPLHAFAVNEASGTIAASFGKTFSFDAKSGLPHGIRLWNLETAEMIKDLRDDSRHAYEHLDFNHDGSLLASAGFRLDPVLWNVGDGVRERRLIGDVVKPDAVEFHPGDRYLSVLGVDGGLRIFDLATAQLHGTVENCWGTAWDPAGRWLAIQPAQNKRTSDGALLLWNLEQGKVERTLTTTKRQVTAFTFDSTGSRIGAVSWYSSRVLVWDSAKPEPLWEAKVNNPSDATFSPDGKYVAAAAMGSDSIGYGAKVFHAETGELIADLPGGDGRKVEFSPDGKWLAVANNSKSTPEVRIFDTTTWKQVQALAGHDWIVVEVMFSPDSKRVFSADMTGRLLAFDRESGQIIRQLDGHGFKVSDMVNSPKGTTLASCSMDGRTILWRTDNYEKLATVIIGKGEDYVITLPGGRYTMSPQAHHLVAFSDQMNSYPFEQFDLRLNRPDHVVQQLGRSTGEIEDLYGKAWSKRVRRMGFQEEALLTKAEIPTLEVVDADQLPISQASRDLTLRVRASDSTPLERLNLYVNDVPVWGMKGRDISSGQSTNYQGEIQVRLGAGRNKIQVSCHNAAGYESLRSTIEMTCTSSAGRRDAYVLAIGVSEYAQSEYSLVYAAKDARDITEAFKGNSLYGQVHTQLITDTKATRETILGARSFLEQAGVDDQVVLFVAGHGVLSEDLDYYFGTHDIDFANPGERGLSYHDLESLVDGIPSRKKMVLMDTCHSGELEEDEGALALAGPPVASGVKAQSSRGLRVVKSTDKENLADLVSKLFADLRRGTGAVVVTSSSGTEFSYEDAKWANGVFSYAVLEGLRDRKAGESDGPIRASELMQYVGERVTELTGGMQTPTMRRANLEQDFLIWR